MRGAMADSSSVAIGRILLRWPNKPSRTHQSFPGLIVLIRRRSRHAEGAHLLQLLARSGASGLANNINFA